jgi:hypothetical protein
MWPVFGKLTGTGLAGRGEGDGHPDGVDAVCGVVAVVVVDRDEALRVREPGARGDGLDGGEGPGLDRGVEVDEGVEPGEQDQHRLDDPEAPLAERGYAGRNVTGGPRHGLSGKTRRRESA